MRSRSRVFAVAIAVLAISSLCALAACSSQAPSSESADSASGAVSEEVQVSGDAPVADSEPVGDQAAEGEAGDSDARQVVTISLDYDSNSGNVWTCEMSPEFVMEQIDRTSFALEGSQATDDANQREQFSFSAMGDGEAVITFTLSSGGSSKAVVETQVYAFTVTDSLEMILNPYKSDFTNEPEFSYQ